MYSINENPVKRRHRHLLIWFVAMLLALVIGYAGVRALQTDTTISPPPPAVVSKVTAPSKKTRTWDEAMFAVNLPTDWKLKSRETDLGRNIYTWQNTAQNPGVQVLSLFIDTPQPTLGLNHVVSVRSNTDKLVVVGDVSDNCKSFTGVSNIKMPAASPAKWDGNDFLCDLDNYLRDVVGTISSDGINKTMLVGNNSGSHNLFFTYTDNTIQADYSIFVDALQSFRLK